MTDRTAGERRIVAGDGRARSRGRRCRSGRPRGRWTAGRGRSRSGSRRRTDASSGESVRGTHPMVGTVEHGAPAGRPVARRSGAGGGGLPIRAGCSRSTSRTPVLWNARGPVVAGGAVAAPPIDRDPQLRDRRRAADVGREVHAVDVGADGVPVLAHVHAEGRARHGWAAATGDVGTTSSAPSSTIDRSRIRPLLMRGGCRIELGAVNGTEGPHRAGRERGDASGGAGRWRTG